MCALSRKGYKHKVRNGVRYTVKYMRIIVAQESLMCASCFDIFICSVSLISNTIHSAMHEQLHKVGVDFTVLETCPSPKKLTPEAAVSKSHNDLFWPSVYPPVECAYSILHHFATVSLQQFIAVLASIDLRDPNSLTDGSDPCVRKQQSSCLPSFCVWAQFYKICPVQHHCHGGTTTNVPEGSSWHHATAIQS